MPDAPADEPEPDDPEVDELEPEELELEEAEPDELPPEELEPEELVLLWPLLDDEVSLPPDEALVAGVGDAPVRLSVR